MVNPTGITGSLPFLRTTLDPSQTHNNPAPGTGAMSLPSSHQDGRTSVSTRRGDGDATRPSGSDARTTWMRGRFEAESKQSGTGIGSARAHILSTPSATSPSDTSEAETPHYNNIEASEAETPHYNNMEASGAETPHYNNIEASEAETPHYNNMEASEAETPHYNNIEASEAETPQWVHAKPEEIGKTSGLQLASARARTEPSR